MMRECDDEGKIIRIAPYVGNELQAKRIRSCVDEKDRHRH